MAIQVSDASHQWLLVAEDWVLGGLFTYDLPTYAVIPGCECKGYKGGNK